MTIGNRTSPSAAPTSGASPARPTLVRHSAPTPIGKHVERNPGTPLDLDVVRAIRVNRSAVERRAATIPTRRTVKKEWQAAWLLRAITCMDLTTLSGDDTPGQCPPALRQGAPSAARRHHRRPWRRPSGITTGAVCVYHALVPTAVEALAGSGIPVAAVSTGFPAGLSPIETRIAEIQRQCRGRRAGDRHRHHARTCAHRQLARALRRGEALPRGLRRRAHEDDSRHRRTRDDDEHRARQHGRDAGRQRFHQDEHRQGTGERDAAGRAW